MSHERMQPLLEAWFKDREATPHDVPDSTSQVIARLPKVRQRGRWWPLPALDRPVSTFPDRELVPAPIPATNGRRRPRGFTMYSTVKFMVASVIVALFGGLLLNGILATQQDGEVAPAAESASLIPTGMEILTLSTRPFGQIGLLATGDDELWVVDAQGVRHVEDGTWTDELDWTTQAPGSNFVWSDLALGPDGTVWVAGPDGVAYRDGERWEFIDGRSAGAVTVDATGTVWAARTRKSGRCLVWTIRDVNGAWVREDIDGCPLQRAALKSLAVDGDGTVWLGGEGGFGPGGLVRNANGEWEAIDGIGDTEVYGSIVLGTDSEGAVWVLSQQNLGTKNVERVTNGPMARFDGDDVSIVELPEGASGWEAGLLGPDGMPWTSSVRGPARFDGQTWQFPYEDANIPRMQVGAVATDGSVYAITSGPGSEIDIVRYPASSE